MTQHPIRRYLLGGLLVWIPLITTVFVIKIIVDFLDNIMTLLPDAYQPQALIGYKIPGLGVVLAFTIVFLTGLLVTNILGKKLVRLGERILDRIPLVRAIYKAVKQVMETLFSSSGDAFRNVLLVEYPRKGLWSIAFQTSTQSPKVSEKTQADMVTIFIPTTPNPTSGFLMMIPRHDVIELDMTVDEALKMVISLGVVQPGKPPIIADH